MSVLLLECAPRAREINAAKRPSKEIRIVGLDFDGVLDKDQHKYGSFKNLFERFEAEATGEHLLVQKMGQVYYDLSLKLNPTTTDVNEAIVAWIRLLNQNNQLSPQKILEVTREIADEMLPQENRDAVDQLRNISPHLQVVLISAALRQFVHAVADILHVEYRYNFSLSKARKEPPKRGVQHMGMNGYYDADEKSKKIRQILALARKYSIPKREVAQRIIMVEDDPGKINTVVPVILVNKKESSSENWYHASHFTQIPQILINWMANNS